MTKKQAIKGLKENLCSLCAYGSQNMDSCDIRECDNRDYIKALEQHEDCVEKLQEIEQIVNKWNNDASHSFSDMCKINGIIKQGQKK